MVVKINNRYWLYNIDGILVQAQVRSSKALFLFALKNAPEEIHFTKLPTFESDLHSIQLRVG